jgi:hypothetical protein
MQDTATSNRFIETSIGDDHDAAPDYNANGGREVARGRLAGKRRIAVALDRSRYRPRSRGLVSGPGL